VSFEELKEAFFVARTVRPEHRTLRARTLSR